VREEDEVKPGDLPAKGNDLLFGDERGGLLMVIKNLSD